MSGLSILLGILTLLFLLAVLVMNLVNRPASKEGFDGVAPAAAAPAPSAIETQIRSVLDNLAFYTSPDGSPSDGEQLCSIFAEVRKQMAKGEDKSLSTTEINKRVEAELETQIPGGALSCPLISYPATGSTDLEWLSFLQDIPIDFGARVIFMAQFADVKLTKGASDLKDALNGSVASSLPDLTKIESFTTICPPTLANTKREDALKASCTLPEDMTPEQIQEAVSLILDQLVSKKAAILNKVIGQRVAADTPSLGSDANPRIHQNILNAQTAIKYLSDQLNAAQAGTLVPTMTSPPTTSGSGAPSSPSSS